MFRRDLSKLLFASAAAAPVLLSNSAQAQTCNPPCYPTTAAETAAEATVVHPEYEPGNVLRYGADPKGHEPNSADSGDAFRAAAKAASLGGGGVVYAPAGIYKVTAKAGDPNNSAITLSGGVRLVGDGPAATVIIPGAANTVLVRVSGLHCGVSHIALDNQDNYTNISGLRLAPPDEAQTTTRNDTEFGMFNDILIRRCDEGLVLRPGPTVGGQDSYLFYNSFVSINIRNCKLGIWLKTPPTQPGSGANRNYFYAVRVGETGTNTGLKIDAGDTNDFFGLSFEGIREGAWPNPVPTAVQIAYNTASYSTVGNRFFGATFEANTRDLDNDNDSTQIFGHFGLSSIFLPNGRQPQFNIGSPTSAQAQFDVRSLHTNASVWSAQPLQLGGYRLWVDGGGRLRIKNGAPASDTDGTIVGTQA